MNMFEDLIPMAHDQTNLPPLANIKRLRLSYLGASFYHSIKGSLLSNLGLLGTREDLNPDAIYPWAMMLQKYQAFNFGLISP